MDSNVIASFQIADWSALITATATIILAFLTGRYVRLTHKILKAQTVPCVIVSVINDELRPTILQLVIKNIGSGLAHDITFEPSRPIPARAFGLSSDSPNRTKNAGVIDDGPLVNGIPALGPGEERRIDWGQYGGLINCLGQEPIIIKCHFRDNVKPMPSTICKLEVKSFEGTSAAERNPGVTAANELEKIAKDLHYLSTGFNKLKVELVKQKETLTD